MSWILFRQVEKSNFKSPWFFWFLGTYHVRQFQKPLDPLDQFPYYIIVNHIELYWINYYLYWFAVVPLWSWGMTSNNTSKICLECVGLFVCAVQPKESTPSTGRWRLGCKFANRPQDGSISPQPPTLFAPSLFIYFSASRPAPTGKTTKEIRQELVVSGQTLPQTVVEGLGCKFANRLKMPQYHHNISLSSHPPLYIYLSSSKPRPTRKTTQEIHQELMIYWPIFVFS